MREYRIWIKEQYNWEDENIPYRMIYLSETDDDDWWVIDGKTGEPMHGEGGRVTDFPYYVMLSIGRKDICNKEIFENDIVKISHPDNYIQKSELIGEVVYSDFGAYKINILKVNKWEGFSENILPPEFIYFLNLGDKKIEVIGNRYENLELLEEIGNEENKERGFTL